MNFRPGGMSDSDDSDDENYYGGGPSSASNNYRAVAVKPKEPTDKEVKEKLNYNKAVLVIQNDGNLDDLEVAFNSGYLTISTIMDQGWSLLHYACKAANPKMIAYLLDKGADVNYVSEKDGFPPYLSLCSSNKCHDVGLMKKCLGLLVEKGALLTLPEHMEMTPIMFAAKENLHELVEVFIQLGVDVNSQDKGGLTALHYAAESGAGRVIRVLLDNGADVQLTTNQGVTAGDIAGTKNLHHIAEVLYRVATTHWTPGADPSLLRSFKDLEDPENNKTKQKREKCVMLPQKELIDMTLDKLGFENLRPLFKEHKIDLLGFLRLTNDDLKSMGITEVGTRQKVLDSIRVLHNTEWNKSSLNSIFLQGNITSPEVHCMLHDVRSHLDFMTQSMAFMQNRLKAEPQALISGSESSRTLELIRYNEAALSAIEELRKEAVALRELFLQLQNGTEFVVGDKVEDKDERKGKMKWYIYGTIAIASAILVSCKIRFSR